MIPGNSECFLYNKKARRKWMTSRLPSIEKVHRGHLLFLTSKQAIKLFTLISYTKPAFVQVIVPKAFV